MLKVPALKIEQAGVTLYITTLPLRDLRRLAKVDDWTPDNEEGYQRPLNERRLGEIAKYVLDPDGGLLPTSILACARSDENAEVQFVQMDEGNGSASGVLEISDDAVLWIVDGQNRLYGVNKAYEKGEQPDLEGYPFPVTIMTGVDRFAEMMHFSIINTTQKKMPTDIVDRHMVARRKREGPSMITRGRAGEKSYQQAKATEVVDLLDGLPGPWEQQIAIPGVVGRDRGLMRQHALVASLDQALKDPWLSTISEEEFAELLARYWRALASVWPDAFDAPSDYRVQATVGVYSLHMVFPTVIHLCLTERDLSEARMRGIWEDSGITADFWSKQEDVGDPLTLGTGMQSIRALAHHLRGELPAAPAVSI